MNPAYEKIWDRKKEDLIENPAAWLDSLDERSREETIKIVRQATEDLQGPGSSDIARIDFPPYRVMRDDGKERLVYARAFPVRDAEGNLERIVGIGTDMTELLAAQQRLRESEEKLRKSQRLEAIDPELDFAGAPGLDRGRNNAFSRPVEHRG